LTSKTPYGKQEHRVEDHLLLYWMKHQPQLMNRGELKADRSLFPEIKSLFKNNRLIFENTRLLLNENRLLFVSATGP